jgi:hypothetical protein
MKGNRIYVQIFGFRFLFLPFVCLLQEFANADISISIKLVQILSILFYFILFYTIFYFMGEQ